jgi:hypothetical protein
MIRLRAIVPAGLFLLCAAALVAGCQSTQSKSAEIAAALGPVQKQKKLTIDKPSKDFEVIDTAVLSDVNGAAAVVTVKNKTDQDMVDVPILINVKDAKDKSIYRNNIPGIEPALQYIPLIRAGQTLDWVNNQVLAVGKPKSVDVTVGDGRPWDAAEPPLQVDTNPVIEVDSVSGVNARGTATNKSPEKLDRLLFFGVARQGDQIVAAGRAAIQDMNPDREKTYHIFFIGDPRDGDSLEVNYFPTLPNTIATQENPNG